MAAAGKGGVPYSGHFGASEEGSGPTRDASSFTVTTVGIRLCAAVHLPAGDVRVGDAQDELRGGAEAADMPEPGPGCPGVGVWGL